MIRPPRVPGYDAGRSMKDILAAVKAMKFVKA